ncbi:MAG: Gldg family protein, partial [Candidatus Krumholzibacteriia bacterium]
MRQLLAIARRETGAFFRSAMAPVVVTCFLLLTGLFFTLIVFGYSQLSAEAQRSGRLAEVMLNLADRVFQPLAVNISVFLLFLLPAVTMRLFAEEYRSGRYDLIMTWPVAEHVWVLGKFTAAMAVMLTLVAGAGAHIAAAGALGRIESGPLLAAGLGLLLAATVNAAWGVFFSTLLPYQVVAYILTFGFLLVLYSIGGLEPHLPGALGRLAADLDLTRHFARFSRGIIDSRDLYYFLAWTGLGLAAASASLGGRRLAGAGRLARWTPVVVAAALLLVVGALVERHAWSADLTSNRRFSPAPQTVRIMQDLRADVHVYAFYQRLDPRREPATVLLTAFADRSRRFHYEFIDPDRDLALVERFHVASGGTMVVEADGRARTLFNPDEASLVNTIYRLVTATQPVIYYVVGHGEHRLDSTDRSGYSAFTQALQSQGYELRQLLLVDEPLVPPDAAVVVLAAPKSDLSPSELEGLRRYIQAGGACLALMDPGTPPGVAGWLAGYNVILGNDYLVTANGAGEGLGFDARVAVVQEGYGQHEITRGLEGLATFFPFAQSLHPAHGAVRGLDARTLLTTGPRSWADRDSSTIAAGRPRYDEGVDHPGPLELGVAIELDL